MTDDDRTLTGTALTELSGVIRSTLGPFGANKLVVDESGAVTTSASGSLVLERLDLQHPVARLLGTEATTFREAADDGTATFGVLAGELVLEANALVEQGLHPTTIERGYTDAAAVVEEYFEDAARPLADVPRTAVPHTALTSVRNPSLNGRIAEELVGVTDRITERRGEFDRRDVAVASRLGSGAQATEVIEGVVLDAEPAHGGMPRRVADAGVAVIPAAVDFRRLGPHDERPRDLRLTLESASYEKRASIRDWEREGFVEALEAAREMGCRFLVTDDAIADRVKTFIAEQGILALQRVDADDLDRLVRATGAAPVASVEDVTPEALGTATVSVRRKAGRDLTYVESDAAVPVHTVFVRAPDPRSTTEFERSVEAALASLASAERTGTVVGGGGAAEMGASRAVRQASRSVGSREQLAMDGFADALTVVPRTLARNGGMDVRTAVMDLRAAHAEGRDTAGIDSLAGSIVDTFGTDPIVDPPRLKRDVVTAATDLSVKIVRTDEWLPATDLSDDEQEREDPLEPEE